MPGTVTIGRYYTAVTIPLTPKAYEAGAFTATVTARDDPGRAEFRDVRLHDRAGDLGVPGEHRRVARDDLA